MTLSGTATAVVVLGFALAFPGCGGGGADGGDSDAAAQRLVDSYNDYVRMFAIPIAQTADRCLSTTFGSVADPECQAWTTWTKQKEDILTRTIESFEVSVSEDRVDDWRKAELVALQLYVEAFRTMARATDSRDNNLWIEGVTRFKAGQEAGKRADQILTEMRAAE